MCFVLLLVSIPLWTANPQDVTSWRPAAKATAVKKKQEFDDLERRATSTLHSSTSASKAAKASNGLGSSPASKSESAHENSFRKLVSETPFFRIVSSLFRCSFSSSFAASLFPPRQIVRLVPPRLLNLLLIFIIFIFFRQRR